jgi:hypothetical protein
MAVIVSKGTLLELTISAVDTAIAQVIGVNVGAQQMETFDTTHLGSGVGKTKANTGYSEQSDTTATIFYDPAQATHQFIAATIATPVETAGNVVLVDGSTTHLAFTAAGLGMDLAVAMNDGLKSNITIVHSGLVGFPTS